jgi:predicted nucleic acid-binding protein
MTPPSKPAPAIVLDATIAVSIASKEATTQAQANAEVTRYLSLGYEFFAPGVLVSETLFALCRMLKNDKSLTAAQHRHAVSDFHTLLNFILPPPQGEISLVLRAEEIRGNYTCYRSADGLYLALAEELSQARTTILLTLDEGMQKQAARNAPSVTVQLVSP